jgi:hypothetical protein
MEAFPEQELTLMGDLLIHGAEKLSSVTENLNTNLLQCGRFFDLHKDTIL